VPWTPRPIEARQVLKSWRENEATRYLRFSNEPWSEPYLGLNDTDSRFVVDDTQTITINTSFGYIVWNITSSANNWLSGHSNHGVLLSVSNEDVVFGRDIRFFSREDSPHTAPYLEILCTSIGIGKILKTCTSYFKQIIGKKGHQPSKQVGIKRC